MGNNWSSFSSWDYENKSPFGAEQRSHSLKSCYMGYYPAINCFFQTLSSSLPLVFAHFDKCTTGWLSPERGWGLLDFLWQIKKILCRSIAIKLVVSLMMIQPLMFWLEVVLCVLAHWRETEDLLTSEYNLVLVRLKRTPLLNCCCSLSFIKQHRGD